MTYEVLTLARNSTFQEIRQAAQPHDVRVWLIDGHIRGRSRKGGKPIYLHKLTDIVKLVKAAD